MSVQQQLYQKVYALADAAQSPEQIKALQQHLSQSLQDNVIPAYVGVPLMQGLTQRLQQATPQAQPARPPVAQQVMQAAQQADMPRQGITQGAGPSEGIDQLPSNLPTEGMAQGGIIAFEDGGEVKHFVQGGYNDLYEAYRQSLVNPNNDPMAESSSAQRLLTRSPKTKYIQARNQEQSQMIENANVNAPSPGIFDITTPQERQAYDARDRIIKQFGQGAFDPTAKSQPLGIETLQSNPVTANPTALTPDTKALADKIALDKANSAPKALASLITRPDDITYTDIPNATSRYDALNTQAPVKAEDETARYKKAIGEDPGAQAVADKLKKMEEQTTAEDEKSPWMALMKAGLATMGGTSPYAGVNVGKGGEAGLEDYGKAQDKIETAREKHLDIQEQLARAKRAEDVAAINFGFNSEEHDKASRHTDKLAEISANNAIDLTNKTNNLQAQTATATNALAYGKARSEEVYQHGVLTNQHESNQIAKDSKLLSKEQIQSMNLLKTSMQPILASLKGTGMADEDAYDAALYKALSQMPDKHIINLGYDPAVVKNAAQTKSAATFVPKDGKLYYQAPNPK